LLYVVAAAAALVSVGFLLGVVCVPPASNWTAPNAACLLSAGCRRAAGHCSKSFTGQAELTKGNTPLAPESQKQLQQHGPLLLLFPLNWPAGGCKSNGPNAKAPPEETTATSKFQVAAARSERLQRPKRLGG